MIEASESNGKRDMGSAEQNQLQRVQHPPALTAQLADWGLHGVLPADQQYDNVQKGRQYRRDERESERQSRFPSAGLSQSTPRLRLSTGRVLTVSGELDYKSLPAKSLERPPYDGFEERSDSGVAQEHRNR